MSIRVLALRFCYWFVLSLVLLAAGGALAAKWWVLPHIDRWRTPIATYLSDASGTRVELGSISAHWNGLRPRFTFNDVAAAGDPMAGDPVAGNPAPGDAPSMHIPNVVAELQWRSFLVGEPRFSYLSMQGMDISLTLGPDNQLRVAGQSIDLTRAESPAQLADNAALQWLRRQGQVSIDDATIHWRDEQRDAPPLTFTQASLALRNTGTRHQVLLAATPMQGLSGPVTLTADMESSLFLPDAAAGDDEQGVIYFDIENMQIERWRPWMDVSQWSGALSGRIWAYLSGGKIGDIQTDVRARSLRWERAPGEYVYGDAVQATFTGAAGNLLPSAWKLPVARVPESDGLAAAFTVTGLDVALPRWFESKPWHAAQGSAQLKLARNAEGGLSARISEARVQSEDVTASLHGQWRNTDEDPLGNLDLQVAFERASLNAIHKYLPRTITGAVRHWLAQALVSGEVRAGKLEVSGPLKAFPYDGENATKGRFIVEGDIREGVLDYLPDWRTQGHTSPWPRIEAMDGRFSIDRTALTIQGDSGVARMAGQEQAITVGPVLAHIPDVMRQATLLVDGQTHGAVSAYLNLVNRSALDGMVDGALRGMSGSGDIRVPLVLNVPLTHSRDAAVRGEINFDGAELQIDQKLPSIKQVAGQLIFTQEQVRAHDLTAFWLGGPVHAEGVVGLRNRQLTLTGRADVRALREWGAEAAALLARMTGHLDYRATFTQAPAGGLDIDVNSDLKGLAIQLPEPFAKTSAQGMALQAMWRASGRPLGREPSSSAQRTGTPRMAASREQGTPAQTGTFDLTLGTSTRIRLEQNSDARAGEPLFARAGVAIDRPLVMPDAGLRVDADLGRADSRPWRDLVRDVQGPTASVPRPRPGGTNAATRARQAEEAAASKSKARPVLGPERDLRLQAEHLVVGRFVFDDLALRAQRSAQVLGKGWDATITSRQAQGRITWTDTPRAEAGKVSAQLSRLMLDPSDAPEKERELAAQEVADGAVEDLSDVPGIDLSVDEFSVYGRAMGSLALSGTNVNDGAQWRLDALQIRNPSADLNAQGMWTARGNNRGLAAVTRIDVHDLGNLLRRLGAPDIVQAGKGVIDARITWGNSPWTHRFRDIDGDLDVDLRGGRLSHVDSGTVKLLELFSLQSLGRIATLKADPSGPLRSGFPFDEVKSHLRLDKGILRVDDYAIDSPVARIKLVGEANVEKRIWDVKATVIPKFDASGAALLTGFVVNPVVGVGALLAQWVLKQPLEAAFTQRYRVSGPWDAPSIESIDRADTTEKGKGTAAQRSNAPFVEP